MPPLTHGPLQAQGLGVTSPFWGHRGKQGPWGAEGPRSRSHEGSGGPSGMGAPHQKTGHSSCPIRSCLLQIHQLPSTFQDSLGKRGQKGRPWKVPGTWGKGFAQKSAESGWAGRAPVSPQTSVPRAIPQAGRTASSGPSTPAQPCCSPPPSPVTSACLFAEPQFNHALFL